MSGAAPAPRWTAHEAREDDDAELLEMFEQVFGFRMSDAHWRWKYADAPMRGTVLRREGRAVAFYGGMPRPVRGPERIHHAVQNGDVMVLPQERGVFTRHGAMYQVSDAFLSGHIGPGRTYEFGFGFPSVRAFALPARLGLYIEGDRMRTLLWAPLPGSRAPLLLREITLTTTMLQALGALWDEMGRSWPGLYVPVRDAVRWRQRYFERPDFDYTVLLVRRRLGGRPVAALALREHPGHVEWLDYVGGAAGVSPAIAAARRFGALCGRKPVTALCSTSAAEALAGDNAAVEDSDIVVPLRAPERGWAQPYPWAGRLWLMGGDSDFL